MCHPVALREYGGVCASACGPAGGMIAPRLCCCASESGGRSCGHTLCVCVCVCTCVVTSLPWNRQLLLADVGAQAGALTCQSGLDDAGGPRGVQPGLAASPISFLKEVCLKSSENVLVNEPFPECPFLGGATEGTFLPGSLPHPHSSLVCHCGVMEPGLLLPWVFFGAGRPLSLRELSAETRLDAVRWKLNLLSGAHNGLITAVGANTRLPGFARGPRSPEPAPDPLHPEPRPGWRQGLRAICQPRAPPQLSSHGAFVYGLLMRYVTVGACLLSGGGGGTHAPLPGRSPPAAGSAEGRLLLPSSPT